MRKFIISIFIFSILASNGYSQRVERNGEAQLRRDKVAEVKPLTEAEEAAHVADIKSRQQQLQDEKEVLQAQLEEQIAALGPNPSPNKIRQRVKQFRRKHLADLRSFRSQEETLKLKRKYLEERKRVVEPPSPEVKRVLDDYNNQRKTILDGQRAHAASVRNLPEDQRKTALKTKEAQVRNQMQLLNQQRREALKAAARTGDRTNL